METNEVLQLDPAHVLADDNSRYDLKKSRLTQLKESIKELGGISTPVEVEPLTPKQGKFTHRLTAGFYRHRAATELNSEENAGIALPALVRPVADSKERLRRQLSENMDRENQSPMDKAIAIKKLLDAGLSKLDVRRIFSTPGGRKGLTLQPASNSFINMSLSFLSLPKAIQEKIHDSRVGVAAAYELTKVSPEKRAAVLERAEADRLKEIEREEKEEERFLAAERRVAEAQEKAKAAVVTVDSTRKEVEEATAQLEEKTLALREVQKTPILELDAAGQKRVTETLKAAEADMKGAQKRKREAENKLAKALQATKTAEEQAGDKAAELAAKKKAKPVKKGVSSAAVKKAAKAEGAPTSSFVKLNASEMRQALKDIVNAASQPKRVKVICEAMLRCFDGESTPRELGTDLGVITGEVKKVA